MIDLFDPRPWHEHPIVVIDFETTGLDSVTAEAVEIGVVRIEGGVIVGEFSMLLSPHWTPEWPEAQAIHGIGPGDIGHELSLDTMINPDIKQIVVGMGREKFFADAKELARLFHDAIPCAYNAPYDRGILSAACSRAFATVEPMQHPIWIDLMVWVWELDKYEKGKTLADACRRRGIEFDGAHRALSDARATAEFLLYMQREMVRSDSFGSGYLLGENGDYIRNKGGWYLKNSFRGWGSTPIGRLLHLQKYMWARHDGER